MWPISFKIIRIKFLGKIPILNNSVGVFSSGAGLGPIGGVVNTRGGAISRGGVEAAEFGGGWNSFCGMGTTGRRAANGLAPCSTSRFDQQQQFVPSPSPSVPGMIACANIFQIPLKKTLRV